MVTTKGLREDKGKKEPYKTNGNDQRITPNGNDQMETPKALSV